MQFPTLASPCVALYSHLFGDVPMWIKRDDLLHAQVSGNKLRKLKYSLQALQGRTATLVTMGGIWSNHVHATAHAAQLCGLRAIALVRGAVGIETPMLADCRALGMQIVWVNRDEYRQLRAQHDWQRHLVDQVTEVIDPVWLPEGGSAPPALRGVAELVEELTTYFAQAHPMAAMPDTLAVACGTGSTLAGLLVGLRGRGRVLGVAVLKNADYLHAEIACLLRDGGYPAYDNYELLTEFHHGGYGKAPPVLRAFCQTFTDQTGVPLEPVYTGKLFYALHQLIASGRLSPQQGVIGIHTGGLQGARGFTY